ncbi:glutamate-1-semialdehyde 2,1-aminomutase [Natrialba aegyptia]|uniref:Glutamate-1-semialdehyde 2,1-aminomutase n=1 Tax=Natrialba aegyptia DSM 13077 TaxID=1227491 RepID=M0ANC3_9EURY|nr:glutamate-1-semialdehyde 2,1-aminomutase [Natrialba aegyptia]ELY99994.1 glutamate-1-semialdehyde aminotransferase [Natrialba aegyptia DSM 13077]
MTQNRNESPSYQLYDRALESLVGGVNSPVRADPQPTPAFVDYGDGGDIVDVDGDRYRDYIMGYGPLLLGHDLPDPVREAISETVADGPMYGIPTEIEVELAEFVIEHVESVERLRFVNSGTEATAAAIRLARGYTGRDKIVVMQGGYHGGHESVLVEGNLGDRGPSSAGIPETFAEETIPVPFNDDEALQEVFDRHGPDIAAVVTEPLLGNCGIVLPVEGYHETIRELCDEYGSLFILDEVITGFRVGGLQCAQGKYGIEPDLTTFAKIIGGGFPVGAIGGRAELMQEFTPMGDVFESGTFNGHPVTMAAGLETLRFAKDHDVYSHVNDLGKQLRAGLQDIVEEHAPEYTVAGTDSMFKLLFTREAPETFDGHCQAGCVQDPDCPRFDLCPKTGADVEAGETDRWKRTFWPAMADRGVLLTPNQLESQFVSYAHTEDDIDRTLDAYQDVLSTRDR